MPLMSLECFTGFWIYESRGGTIVSGGKKIHPVSKAFDYILLLLLNHCLLQLIDITHLSRVYA